MLSDDKLIRCEGTENVTSGINELRGATIVSPICLSLAGIAGHIVALYHLHRSTRPAHSKTVFYVLLATLIWTDLIGKLITTPPAIVSYAYGQWVGGERLCHFHGYCMMLIDTVTHFLVSSMALDRFVCVRYCYLYKSSVTKSKARTMLMTIWLFCLVFCSLPLFGIGQFEPQYPGTWCFVNIHVSSETPWYHRLYSNIFGLMNLFNILVICVCNVIVIGILLHARIARNRKLSASSVQTQRSLMQKELEVQMSIVLLVITVVFLVSWSPLDILLFMNQIWPHTCLEEHFADLVAVRLASFNQIIDPWVYIICRRAFTSKLWKSCRSLIIGRHFSSKRKRNSIDLHVTRNAARGGESSASKFKESLESIRHKGSLKIQQKATIFSKNSVELLNEKKDTQCVFQSIKERIRKVSEKQKGKSEVSDVRGQNLDKGKPCVCRKMGMAKRKGEHLELELDRTLLDPSSRMQFRIPSLKHSEFSPSLHKRLIVSKSTQSYTFMLREDPEIEAKRKRILRCRRHSWSSSPSSYKLFRTRSTQTLERN